MRIVTTLPAQREINDIFQYHLEKANRKIARQEQTKIIKRIKTLKNFPFLGQKEENEKFVNSEYRYLIEGNFKIVYKVEEDDIVILSIFHTMQNPSKMSI